MRGGEEAADEVRRMKRATPSRRTGTSRQHGRDDEGETEMRRRGCDDCWGIRGTSTSWLCGEDGEGEGEMGRGGGGNRWGSRGGPRAANVKTRQMNLDRPCKKPRSNSFAPVRFEPCDGDPTVDGCGDRSLMQF